MLELSEVRQMTEEILLADPDTRMEGDACVYFTDEGDPVCVVGKLFCRIGIRKEDLVKELKFCNPNTTQVYLLRNTWLNKISYPAVAFLDTIQQSQDRGASWGEIHEKFYGSDEDATG